MVGRRRRALGALTLRGWAASAPAGELDGFTGRLKYNDGGHDCEIVLAGVAFKF